MGQRDIPEVADFQEGVFSREQAYAEGWTPRQVRRRVVAGRWRPFAGRALCPARQEIGAWQLAFAVALTWPNGVVSHQVAGVLYGFPIRLGAVGTAIVDRHSSVQAQGLRAFRCHLPPEEVGLIGGLTATTRARTATDLLAGLAWPDARNLWAWISTRRVLGTAELRAAVTGRAGQHGTPQLRRLLEASATGSLSAAEDLLHDLLRRAGITGWVANARVVLNGRLVAVVDVLFEQQKVVVEVDGWSTHSQREVFQSDRTKQNALTLAGYVVLRVTWDDLTKRPAEVARQVRSAISILR
jgi:very-short-patch-repair endonuclease